MNKIVLALFMGIAFVGCTNEKTAYVDTTKLIQEYSEMKDVEADFSEKSQELRSQLEGVAGEFEAEVREYQENRDNMTRAQREETEAKLMQKQQMLQQQQQMSSEQLRDQSDQVVDSLVQKVRSFVKVYGEENNYTYIFGSNESANIMYAKEGLDITEEVLEELNAGAEISED